MFVPDYIIITIFSLILSVDSLLHSSGAVSQRLPIFTKIIINGGNSVKLHNQFVSFVLESLILIIKIIIFIGMQLISQDNLHYAEKAASTVCTLQYLYINTLYSVLALLIAF